MVTLINGDTLALLRDENGFRDPISGKLLRVDACISDPPYGIDFAGDRSWDSFGITSSVAARPGHAFERWCELWARPLFTDVILPGGHIVAFSSERTIHRITSGIEDAGFEMIGGIAWLYATGQVKSKDRMRPAYEPIAVGRKNADDKTLVQIFKKDGRGLMHSATLSKEDGRHPSNLVVEEGVETDIELRGGEFFYVAKASVKDRDYGCESLAMVKRESALSGISTRCETCDEKQKNVSPSVLDEPCPKCGGKVIYTGGVSGASGEARNFHPTVKPINLMRRIIRLVTKPGHTIIDPFMGSGTTGVAAVLEGRNFIGIERESEFFTICHYRIAQALRDTGDLAGAEALMAGVAGYGAGGGVSEGALGEPGLAGAVAAGKPVGSA